MTGHREPPAEWIPLTTAIARIHEVWTAFEEALAFDGTDYADDVTPVSTRHDAVGGFYPSCFEVMGHRVMVMATGMHVIPSPNNLDSLDKVYKRVKRAEHQAVDRIRQLVDDGYYRLHGRHGSLLADHLPIPTDVVQARKVDFDIGSGTAIYADGSTAEFVHLERTDKLSITQVVAGMMLPNIEDWQAKPTTSNEQKRPARARCLRWFRSEVLAKPERKIMHRADMIVRSVAEFGISKRQAISVCNEVTGGLPLEHAKHYEAGRPRKNDTKNPLTDMNSRR